MLSNKRPNGNRIAIFIPDCAGGGAEKVTVNLVNNLVKKGFYLDLVVLEAKGPFLNYLSKDVTLVNLSQSLDNKYISKLKTWKFLQYVFFVFALFRYLRTRNIRVLLTSLHLTSTISLIVKKYFFKKVKLIICIHNTFSMELKIDRTAKEWKSSIFVNFLLSTADSIVTVSQGVEDDLKLHNPSISHLVHTIYNPLISPHISRLVSESLSHPWIDKQDYRIILTVNRLYPVKDVTTLIKAFAKIIKLESSSRLIILGDGPEKPRLESLARQLEVYDFIDFVGFMPNPYSWMAKAHVFVLSSIHEGLPSVLIEAMACGTSVVSTDCPHGPREILQDGKLGSLVPVGDHEQLARAILDILHRPIPSNLLIERAKDFSIDSSVEAYSNLFKRMIV